VAERIKGFFSPFFQPSLTFETFCEILERLLLPQHVEKVKRLAFSIYDFNEDRQIDELDVYCFYYVFDKENPDIFMALYFDDLIKIISQLQAKQIERGFEDRDIDLKLKKIKARLDRIKRGERRAAHTVADAEEAREEIRRFVFEEFVKKDPDNISFRRPDSGSGVPEVDDEDDGDDESWYDEEEDILNDLFKGNEGVQKSRTAAKSRFSSKRSQGGSDKTHKTSRTQKSKRSSRSNRTSKSRTQGSRRNSVAASSAKSFESIFDKEAPFANDKLLEQGNPHGQVINRRFLYGFKKNKTYIEALRIADFKKIDFDQQAGGLPVIVRDIFKYIALIDIEEICKQQIRKQKMQQKAQ
jgi:hypothetical protein